MMFEAMKNAGITTITTTNTKFTVDCLPYDFYICIENGYMVALAVDLGDEIKYLVQGYTPNKSYHEYGLDLRHTLYSRFGVIEKNGVWKYPPDLRVF